MQSPFETAPATSAIPIYFATKATILGLYIHATDDTRMPPPPAPALTHRQIEVFDNWMAETPPAP